MLVMTQCPQVLVMTQCPTVVPVLAVHHRLPPDLIWTNMSVTYTETNISFEVTVKQRCVLHDEHTPYFTDKSTRSHAHTDTPPFVLARMDSSHGSLRVGS